MPDFDCLECVMPVTLQSHALTMLKKTCLIVPGCRGVSFFYVGVACSRNAKNASHDTAEMLVCIVYVSSYNTFVYW